MAAPSRAAAARTSRVARPRGAANAPKAAPAAARARPFLKWVGGKRQLMPQLLARFPPTFGRYVEPFLGGGAAFFALAPRRALLADINAELIATYVAVRDDVEGVIRELRGHRATAEHFYQVRAQDPATLAPAARAARTIYLNRTCFNGLYRVNRRGGFNVPFGHYARPTICQPEALRLAAGALRRVTLRHACALTACAALRRDDLVYFDPPYDPVSPTSNFVGYASAGFGRAEQEALAQLFARLAKGGVHVVLSNADTPLVRELYRDFRIHSVTARRAVNRDGKKRGPVREVIVTAR